MTTGLDRSAAAATKEGAAAKRGWKQRFNHELRRFVGIFLYLWAIFALLLMHEAVVLARYQIPFTRWGVGFVTALVLAKVMLVLEELNLPRAFQARPLIYPIAYKAGLFAIVFIVFYVAEETATGVLRGRTLAESIPAIGGGTPLGIVLSLIIVTFALIPYCALRELGRVFGRDELRALLFTRGVTSRMGTRPG